MQITAVIPTCNRKARLLNLLQSLNQSSCPLYEVIIVDSGEDRLTEKDWTVFDKLPINYISSEKSVCIQRNIGINKATSNWIFLCDDDVEVPADYLSKLTTHITHNAGAGAVSGQWLQKEKDGWQASWPVVSTFDCWRKYVFQLGAWGEIRLSKESTLGQQLKKYYQAKGNHISKAGWPVITQMDGVFYTTPSYTLGAALVRRDWLLQSPFDEVLDRYGIGDNYGVALGFPGNEIHIVNDAPVYHHHEPANRLVRPLQYYRRALALDYFIKTKKPLLRARRRWLLWSLFGNLLMFIWVREGKMIKASLKAMVKILFNINPYYKAKREGKKVVEPLL